MHQGMVLHRPVYRAAGRDIRIEFTLFCNRSKPALPSRTRACQLLCACMQVIASGSNSNEQLVPFPMLPGRGRAASRKALIQQLEIGYFVLLYQYPVRQRAATRATDLVCQQLDRAVEDSVVVWLENAKPTVIEQPNQAPVFDGPPEHRVRLQRHIQPFWRDFRLPGADHPVFASLLSPPRASSGLTADEALSAPSRRAFPSNGSALLAPFHPNL